jgi:hypothetical protein
MKCIKAIKDSYQGKLGEVKRLSDNEAEEKVKLGLWKYIPKDEYRKAIRPENYKLIIKNEKNSKKNRMGI